ncbi:hypothetical protein FDB52_05765 [Clostridium botulinum]|nr:hypothetical protein [Clostridium botulinum]NFN48062.1 hypothetical protein [Clostridium botulinum]NFO30983.1 hypothetical protein [Clostridium botulinum]NFO54242.1 hypothetical protein [Clostridium botulinum]
MVAKEFIDKSGTNLIIEHNKTNIIFKTENKNIKNEYNLILYFSENVFKEITKYLENISREIWKDFTTKEANSVSSDYAEYYDRKYDNNGYLSIIKYNGFKIERPYKDCLYMYKFNKRRMESFIYDLNK